MLFRRWTKLPSGLMAITGVLVGTHVQEKRRLRNSWANMPKAIRIRERSDTIVLEHPNERITER
jgi:hypothetical protein